MEKVFVGEVSDKYRPELFRIAVESVEQVLDDFEIASDESVFVPVLGLPEFPPKLDSDSVFRFGVGFRLSGSFARRFHIGRFLNTRVSGKCIIVFNTRR